MTSSLGKITSKDKVIKKKIQAGDNFSLFIANCVSNQDVMGSRSQTAQPLLTLRQLFLLWSTFFDLSNSLHSLSLFNLNFFCLSPSIYCFQRSCHLSGREIRELLLSRIKAFVKAVVSKLHLGGLFSQKLDVLYHEIYISLFIMCDMKENGCWKR